jgi:hypothetical protein
MFTVFHVWSKNLTSNDDDFAGGVPYAGDEAKIKLYDYSYSQWARPRKFAVNFIFLDLSLSKIFKVGKQVEMEVCLDAFNALSQTQFTGVNATANFASLTDHTITNLPHGANGNLIRNNGFGSINGVAAPRTLQLVTRLTF